MLSIFLILLYSTSPSFAPDSESASARFAGAKMNISPVPSSSGDWPPETKEVYRPVLEKAPSRSNQESPRKLAWAVLGMTTYTEDRLTEKYKPKFPDVLQDRFAGERVIITGYLIPIDVEEHRYALSKNPFSSCFFCGQAGPETVIELKFLEDPGRFATDRYLPVEGKLRLNRHGGDLFFTLLEAKIAG